MLVVGGVRSSWTGTYVMTFFVYLFLTEYGLVFRPCRRNISVLSALFVADARCGVARRERKTRSGLFFLNSTSGVCRSRPLEPPEPAAGAADDRGWMKRRRT